MTETIDETKQDVHGLDNLPEKQKKETEEILSDIQKEEDAKAPKPKDGEALAKSEEELKKEADAKAEADRIKAEEDAKTGDKGSKDNTRRVPSYVLGIEKARAEKREKELLAEIETLKAGAKPDGNDGDSKVKAIVDKIVADNEVEDPKVIADLMKAVTDIVKDNKAVLPEDLAEKLKVVDDLKIQHEVAIEEANFNADFDKNILSMIKAEYGDEIPAEKIAEIKAKLKTIAYSPEYAKIPYDEIYSGKKDFRSLYTPKKRSAEGGHGAGIDLTNGKKVFSEELSDDEFNKLTPDEQEEYGNQMAKKERNRG